MFGHSQISWTKASPDLTATVSVAGGGLLHVMSQEEEYANRLIQEFKSGLLPLTDGTTLRTFLSKLLNCDPMRISKKFVGSNCIGKQVRHALCCCGCCCCCCCRCYYIDLYLCYIVAYRVIASIIPCCRLCCVPYLGVSTSRSC